MRMRRERNLEPRMDACADILVARGRPCLNLKEAAENYRALIDAEKIFGNCNPVHLEIGCGNGGFLKEVARRNPQINFLAVEVCSNVILTAMENVKAAKLTNVRFLNIPAETLECYIAPHCVERIYLNFSTPLPEKGREKQRLTSSRFLAIYKTLLTEHGEVWQKTDSEQFFDYSLEQYTANGFIVKEITRDLHHSEYALENVVTEYEAQFAGRGLPIYRAVAILE